jgi:hypothetical protein
MLNSLKILVPVLLTSLAVSACSESVSIGGGSLSKTEIEDGATKTLTAKVGQAPASFVCPSDLEAKVGESETCILTANGGQTFDTTVTITSISDDDSNARYEVQVADHPNP